MLQIVKLVVWFHGLDVEQVEELVGHQLLLLDVVFEFYVILNHFISLSFDVVQERTWLWLIIHQTFHLNRDLVPSGLFRDIYFLHWLSFDISFTKPISQIISTVFGCSKTALQN